jgi:hypothetical protein
MRRARRQTAYAPVMEDWVWHVLLPYGCYIDLSLTSLFLRIGPRFMAFVIAGATLVLLVIGIHNAWDSVTHMIVAAARDRRDKS